MTESAHAGLAIPGLDTHAPAESPELLSCFIFGGSGVGKTVLAGTAADDGRSSPVLYVDAEGGIGSFSWRQNKVAVFDFRDFMRDATAIARALKDQPEIKTVVVDSLTEVGWLCMQSVTGGSAEMPSTDDWQRWTSRMRSFLAMIKQRTDRRYHLIVTGLEEPGGPKGDMFIPSFPGKKLAYNLGAPFNTVARLHTVDVAKGDRVATVRRLALQTTPRFNAKDRMDQLGDLPAYLDNPTVSDLLDRLEEGKRRAQAAQGE